MIVSFDIDNTLIPYSDEFPVEEATLLGRVLGAEPLRQGTKFLFRELQSRGHNIFLYTTSYRSRYNLSRTFISYGLRPAKIINQQLNQSRLRQIGCQASKNPNLFGIDLHVDDSLGVLLEGGQYDFRVALIQPEDEQ